MMIIKTTAILLFLFIFGIITQVSANSVKSTKNAVNQETIMKIDENKVALQKKAGDSKESIKSLKIKKDKAPLSLPYSDYEEIIMSSQFDVNFSKTLGEKKRFPFLHSVNKVIYSYGFSQNALREKFLNIRGVAEVKPSNPNMGQSQLESYSFGNKYFEERRILETFKLLQFKREEISKGIVMGFRFSFNPVSGHLFLETNVTPSSEKISGLTIPF
ncbi:MAG: hypothetical protein A2026_05270 [Deltaproteobacteria bacterium RBG_19FT_COMBO_46_12]|nr:MAG: hypothetical protein A2026_05270 [Deltaproteobacteria bacterium RBG_19FT_COMBO_46_12]